METKNDEKSAHNLFVKIVTILHIKIVILLDICLLVNIWHIIWRQLET